MHACWQQSASHKLFVISNALLCICLKSEQVVAHSVRYTMHLHAAQGDRCNQSSGRDHVPAADSRDSLLLAAYIASASWFRRCAVLQRSSLC
jgi:hypothetical protein